MKRTELSLLRKWWKEDFKKMIQARDEAEKRYRTRHGLVEPTPKQIKKHYLEMVPKTDFPKNLAWDYPPQIYENINIPIPSYIMKILEKTWDSSEFLDISRRENRKRKESTTRTARTSGCQDHFENKDYALSKFMYEEDGFAEYADRMSRMARLQFEEKYDNPLLNETGNDNTQKTESSLEDTI